MTLDRQVLQRLSAQSSPPIGIAALPRGIHRTPGLREWVTMESVALAPVPVWRGDRWGLVSLLTTPTRLADGSPGWHQPWGAIEWSLPDHQVVQKIDLTHPEQSALLSSALPDAGSNTGAFSMQPADPQVELNSRSRTLRENALFQALEQFFVAANPAQLSSLAPHYSGLIPAGFYPYYHSLIPDSQTWLRPDLPAVALSESVSSPTADLSSYLPSWLRQGQALAEAFSLKEMVVELKQLEARQKLPGFRLAIVGEFSRGKSSLINRLLEREILPVGAVPTTATLVSILPGTEDRMQLNPGQPETEIRPLELPSWDDLLAVDSTGQDRTVLTTVRITLDHPWLQALDVELIDTPGAGDLSEQRAALISDLLSQCDAAVLVISSTLPFSLTEKSFLEEKVIGQHVPRILVVVSKLDTIDPAEQVEVFQTLQERIAQVSDKIPVLPAHPVDATLSEAEALAALRTQIEVMAAQDDRRTWRSRQIAGQLVDRLERMIAIGSEAITLAQMSAGERSQALKQVEAELQEADLRWEQLKLELDQCRLQRDQQVRLHILEARQELLDLLKLELERTPEPKVWWQRDLPFRVRRELVGLSRKSEDFLLKAIAQDLEWLDGEMAQAFTTHFSRQGEPIRAKLEIQPDYGQVSLTDTKRYRLLTRLGCSGGVLCGYIFGGPIGIIASTGIWFLGEQLLTKEVESQRQQLMLELDRRVGRAIDTYCTAVSDRFRSLYRQVADDLHQEQLAWRSARREALQSSLERPEEKPWQQLVDQASELKQDILTVL